MKKTTTQFFLLMGFACLGFFSSCAEAIYDTDPPELIFIAPSALEQFSAGDLLPIEMEVTDDIFLDKIFFELEGPSVLDLGWDTLLEANLYGESAKINLDLTIPFNAPSGTYTLSAYAVDGRGRIGDEVVSQIIVTNQSDAEAPVLSLTKDTIRTFPSTQIFTVSGQVSDNQLVESIQFEVRRQDTQQLMETSEKLVGTANYQFQEFLNNPGEGTYAVKVRAFDGVLNTDEQELILIVN